ncbi:cupin domain-containing protein [Allosphingosinicella flava]|uniref:Cupin domain-containing protein n=1 Tax=Allosphingosinicella flava TaxID=2771430 RepID=A0A7T2GKD8_9SPHN|nr:cupin domain-containing protein [Sphingosinicella flava]QPQ55475.1 cupin domain-containing protein [Sphingosinicella flava]
MPKIDLDAIEATNRTGYPMPFAADMGGRWFRRLAPAGGLSDFGVSHVTLKPGGISSQRHWHDTVDEFLVMLDGEAVLVEEGSETVLRPGDCAAFPKGAPNGHHLVNRTEADCTFVVAGSPDSGQCHYPDIDLLWDSAAGIYRHKDGEPY